MNTAMASCEGQASVYGLLSRLAQVIGSHESGITAAAASRRLRSRAYDVLLGLQGVCTSAKRDAYTVCGVFCPLKLSRG